MKTVIRRVVAVLPSFIRTLACRLLRVHSAMPDVTRTPLALSCSVCGYQSEGIGATSAPPVITQPGDPRASAMRSRRAWQEPEPPAPDWFEAEHFQGDHARVS